MPILTLKVLMPIIEAVVVLIGITVVLKMLQRELPCVNETLADIADVFVSDVWPKMAGIIGVVVAAVAIINGLVNSIK